MVHNMIYESGVSLLYDISICYGRDNTSYFARTSFSFRHHVQTGSGDNNFPIQKTQGNSHPRVKQAVRETDHPPLSSKQVYCK